MKELVQDDKILLRLPKLLTDAIDQVLKEQLPGSNRSEFIRRAVRFTIDNIDQFKKSNASTISEKEDVESIAKVNTLRDLHEQLFTYKEILQKEPQTPNSIKQVSMLLYIVGKMIYTMNEN